VSSEQPNVSDDRDDSASAAARDARRWLIGVGISLAFGLFGVVMALLSYIERTSPAAPSGVNVPARRAEEPAAPRRERRQSERHK
jgi:hypothetical protein